MPDTDVDTARRADDADAPHEPQEQQSDGSYDKAKNELSIGGLADKNEPELSSHEAAKDDPPTTDEAKDAVLTPDHKRKREPESDTIEPHDGDDADEFARQFSLAQVRVKVKRARLEANIAVQDELKTLRFALLKAEHEAQERERERQEAEKRHETLRERMEEIVRMHQRTLNGMRDTIDLENLVASLDREKASKEALRDAFQKQNAELLKAQQRIESLQSQIIKYQKTETVLAESITHFQHQFSSKDQERAAVIERVKQSLEAQHQETRVALEEDVQRLTMQRDSLQAQLQELQVEHGALQESAQAVLEQQEKREKDQAELRARIAQFDTEKAVLVSKVDQVQKADAQLRSKIKSLEEQLFKLQQDNELLRSENVELGKIASDLMDMAEQQHAEKQQILQQPDEEGGERLARTRTRLRESLG